MTGSFNKHAHHSRLEIMDALVGVRPLEARVDALHGYLVAAIELLNEEGGEVLADNILLAARFRVLKRGSSSLRGGKK